MRTKKTGHHIIPNRSYLQNFSDSSGKIWVLDVDNKIYPTNPTNIFKEKHFYTIKLAGGGGSLVVEDTLANIEATYASIFHNKIANHLPITIEEKAQVSVFLGALHLRTKPHREGLRSVLKNLHTQMNEWKAMFISNAQARELSLRRVSNDDETVDIRDIEYAIENIDDLHTNTMIDALPQISQRIFEMDWQYLPAPSDEVFITTDDPLRLLRPDAIKKYGANAFGSIPSLEYIDTEFTVPLSSQLALYGARKGVGDGLLQIDKRQLDQINYRTMMHTNDKIVACQKKILDDIRERIEAKNTQLTG